MARQQAFSMITKRSCTHPCVDMHGSETMRAATMSVQWSGQCSSASELMECASKSRVLDECSELTRMLGGSRASGMHRPHHRHGGMSDAAGSSRRRGPRHSHRRLTALTHRPRMQQPQHWQCCRVGGRLTAPATLPPEAGQTGTPGAGNQQQSLFPSWQLRKHQCQC